MHATKATAHTARPWLRTTVICNARATTSPQYTYPYPYYAHTIYVPPTNPWSVSTRLVLTRLRIPSPLTTEDHNADALQIFGESHLRLHYICTANLSMVGLNKACTNASARSEPIDGRGSKRICTTTIFRMPPLVIKPYSAPILLSSSSRCPSTCGTHRSLFDDSPQPLSL